MEKADIKIDYKELMNDNVVKLHITNVPAGNVQLKVVEALLWVVNIYSPVKFDVLLEK